MRLANHHLLLIKGLPKGVLRVPAEAGGVCDVVRLSPAVLRSELRWLRASYDDPVGCGS